MQIDPALSGTDDRMYMAKSMANNTIMLCGDFQSTVSQSSRWSYLKTTKALKDLTGLTMHTD